MTSPGCPRHFSKAPVRFVWRGGASVAREAPPLGGGGAGGCRGCPPAAAGWAGPAPGPMPNRRRPDLPACWYALPLLVVFLVDARPLLAVLARHPRRWHDPPPPRGLPRARRRLLAHGAGQESAGAGAGATAGTAAGDLPKQPRAAPGDGWGPGAWQGVWPGRRARGGYCPAATVGTFLGASYLACAVWWLWREPRESTADGGGICNGTGAPVEVSEPACA